MSGEETIQKVLTNANISESTRYFSGAAGGATGFWLGWELVMSIGPSSKDALGRIVNVLTIGTTTIVGVVAGTALASKLGANM